MTDRERELEAEVARLKAEVWEAQDAYCNQKAINVAAQVRAEAAEREAEALRAALRTIIELPAIEPWRVHVQELRSVAARALADKPTSPQDEMVR